MKLYWITDSEFIKININNTNWVKVGTLCTTDINGMVCVAETGEELLSVEARDAHKWPLIPVAEEIVNTELFRMLYES